MVEELLSKNGLLDNLRMSKELKLNIKELTGDSSPDMSLSTTSLLSSRSTILRQEKKNIKIIQD
jgi:hypothetical protein